MRFIVIKLLDKRRCLCYNVLKGDDIMAQVSFRIDDEIKNQAERALDDMGLTMSAAITVFLKKVGREHRIPFEINADPFYSAANMERLRKSAAQMEQTGGTVHEIGESDV